MAACGLKVGPAIAHAKVTITMSDKTMRGPVFLARHPLAETCVESDARIMAVPSDIAAVAGVRRPL